MKFIGISMLVFSLLYVWPMSSLSLEDYQKDSITVYIQGEVEEERKVVLEEYSTIEEALSYVTLTKDADISGLNPLMIVKDQDVICIPKKSEAIKISINTGSLEDLMMIPGIGEAKALKIIAYREEHGLFQTLEDLMNIDGIKQKTFDKLKEFICL